MAQAIVTVLILLIFVAYAVFFAIWNPGTMTVVGLYLNEQMSWGADVPLFVLPLAGVVIGAIIMAIAVSAPWSSLKSKLAAAQDQLGAERARSKECARKVESLKERLRKMQSGAAPSGSGESPPGAEGSDEDTA
jgi:uncharacterized membrane protein YgaE (UPF0421/DUF939 family)